MLHRDALHKGWMLKGMPCKEDKFYKGMAHKEDGSDQGVAHREYECHKGMP